MSNIDTILDQMNALVAEAFTNCFPDANLVDIPSWDLRHFNDGTFGYHFADWCVDFDGDTARVIAAGDIEATREIEGGHLVSNPLDVTVHLPGRISATRKPWTGTIRELIDLDGDARTETVLHYAEEIGAIEDAEGDAEMERFDGLLPVLLATNTEALRRFTDDPNAEIVK